MTLSWETVLEQVTAKLNSRPTEEWNIPFVAERSYNPKDDLDKLQETDNPQVWVFPATEHVVAPASRRTNRVTFPVAVGVGRKVSATNGPAVLDANLLLAQQIRIYLTNVQYTEGQTGGVRIINAYDAAKYREHALFQSFTIFDIYGYEPVV